MSETNMVERIADATDLVIVAHPDDEILEFYSILFPTQGLQPWVVVCTEGNSHRSCFLSQLLASGKLPYVMFSPQQSHFDRKLDLDALVKFLIKCQPPNLKQIWTHNPADGHHQHCQVALSVSRAFPETPTFYSHGVVYQEYQFVADICNQLSLIQIENKIEMLNSNYSDQLKYHRRWNSPGINTHSILSVERFFRLSPKEVQCLYALRHSMDCDFEKNDDPRCFIHSLYESERLDATIAFVKHWLDPDVHTIVEVGSCRGNLTQRLYNSGYHAFIVCEPNEQSRKRLVNKLQGCNIKIIDYDLEKLSGSREFRSDAYLLFEVIYYLNDFSVLNNLQTDSLLISLCDDFYYEVFKPWLDHNDDWRIVEEQVLVEPRIEYIIDKKAYRRKAGSRGIVLYRKHIAR